MDNNFWWFPDGLNCIPVSFKNIKESDYDWYYKTYPELVVSFIEIENPPEMTDNDWLAIREQLRAFENEYVDL